MVETSTNNDTGLTTIVLKPNNSASWRLNMVIFGSLSFALLLVSLIYASFGLWLVLPFAGLEIIALFVCIYLRLRANHSIEVITFDETTVIVERGFNRAEKSWKYHRLWTKIFVRKPDYKGHPKRIFIRSHGKELELGSFLNKQDKEILIKDLQGAVYA
jgi:uncharacterized membrane protein